VKFLADMGISPKTVAFLHALGHDAVHLADQGLERLLVQHFVSPYQVLIDSLSGPF